MGWPRRVVVVVACLPVAAVALLAVEATMARRGVMLDPATLDLDGRVGPVAGDGLVVVWLGDSTAAGVGASGAAAALPVVVSEALGRPVDLAVAARSGATVAQVVERQLPELADADPDVVVVSVGANDVTHLNSREDFEREYRHLLTRLPGEARVVLLGVPDLGAIPRLAQPLRAVTGWRGEQFDDVVRDLADDTASTYVDIAAATGLAFRADPERYFASDGYHPSDAGYRRWADAVLDAVSSTMLAS